MRISKKLKIGVSEYEISAEGKDLHESLMELQKVSIYNLEKCGLCGSEFLRLSAYVTKEGSYNYVKVTCGKCRGSLTLGESKKDHANYYRKNKEGNLDWQPYQGASEGPQRPEKEILWDD